MESKSKSEVTNGSLPTETEEPHRRGGNILGIGDGRGHEKNTVFTESTKQESYGFIATKAESARPVMDLPQVLCVYITAVSSVF